MAADPSTAAEPASLLEWDSRFFGLRIGRVRGDRLDAEGAARVEQWAEANAADMVYFLACTDCPATVRVAEDAGYHQVDIRVTFARPVPVGFPADPAARPAGPGDLDALRPLCRTGFRDGRFHADGRFDPVRCDDFYAAWLENSLGGFADAVWVIDHAGVAAGFITCTADRAAGRGSIGLVGVAEAARGRGVGARLVRQALAWSAAEGLAELAVVTQGRNLAAQRLYQREAFLTESLGLWYHKWFHPPGISA